MVVSAKTNDLGHLAVNKMFDKISAIYRQIDIHEPIPTLNNATFHEWLLTNPDKRAFEIWKRIREKEKLDGTYKSENYADSAALILWANLPQRLKCLNKEEWVSSIDNTTLVEKGIYFQLDKAKRNIQDYFNDEGRYSTINAIDIAAMHGSLDLIKTAKESMSSGNQQDNINSFHYYYIMHGENVAIEPIIEILREWFPDDNSKKLTQLFKSAVSFSSVKQLKAIWSRIKDYDKNLFMFNNYYATIETALKRGRIEVAEYIYFLSQTHNKEQHNQKLPLYLLCDCVNRGNLDSVEFIIQKNPELLKERFPIQQEKQKINTALTLAVMNLDIEMACLLLSYGANTKPLTDLINHKPFIKKKTEEGGWIEFLACAENSLLRRSLNMNSSHQRKVKKNLKNEILL